MCNVHGQEGLVCPVGTCFPLCFVLTSHTDRFATTKQNKLQQLQLSFVTAVHPAACHCQPTTPLIWCQPVCCYSWLMLRPGRMIVNVEVVSDTVWCACRAGPCLILQTLGPAATAWQLLTTPAAHSCTQSLVLHGQAAPGEGHPAGQAAAA